MALIHENSDWASLPVHLLDKIVATLVEFSDFIHFAAVCKPWFSVAIHNKKMLSSRKQVPMLLVPSTNKISQRRDLYNIIKNRHYNFELNLSYIKRCCGSSHGCLATLDQDYSINLINPFITSGVNSITLPPIMKKANTQNFDVDEYGVHKVILSANPWEAENYMVVAITQFLNLGFIKHEGTGWTYIENIRGLTDVIYYQGKFCATEQYGNIIVSLDPNDGLGICIQSICVEPRIIDERMCQPYLVESSTGDLLLVHRWFVEQDDSFCHYMTSDFTVAKLKYNADGNRVTYTRAELNNLGDQALFVGDNHSYSVVASEFPGLQPNSIYYTDDFYWITVYEPFGPRDMGVFNLENKNIKAHYTPDPSNKKLPPPIWILPTLQGRMSFTIGDEHESLADKGE